MRLAPDGKKAGIMTSDGYVKLFDLKSEKIEIEQKRHRLPVTCLGFKTDQSGHPLYILSGSPDYTYNIISCQYSLIGNVFFSFLYSQ